MTIHEVTFKFNSESLRHKALLVLFEEIRSLELLHNEKDARIAAALDLCATTLTSPCDPHCRVIEVRRALTEERND